MAILEVVNSIVSKPGNVAVRTGHIMNNDQNALVSACICRGAIGDFPQVKIFSMGLIGYIPRILNYIRNYFPKFDHRPLDIMIFNIHFYIAYVIFGIGRGLKVAHLWEMSPFIIKLLQKDGVLVILDVPIAPALFAKRRYGADDEFIIFDAHIKYENKSFDMADLIIAPSNFVRNALIEIGCDSQKIQVIEFGSSVKPTKQDKDLRLNNFEDRGCSFVFAGALNPRKGLGTLIDVWSTWPYKEDQLHLCGAVTPYVDRLLSRKFPANVRTPGFVDVQKYFGGMDIFVFPSLLEGSAKAIFEALGAGLPCIVTDESGSVVRDGQDGYIVPVGDIAKLRSAMLKTRNATNFKDLKDSAYRRANDFTWSRYTRQVLHLYERESRSIKQY